MFVADHHVTVVAWSTDVEDAWSRYLHLLDVHFRYRMGIQGPELDVFLWNILQNKKELALQMWQHVRYPVRTAIVGMNI